MATPDFPSPIALEEIFRIAAEMPAAERAAYLKAACEGRPEMRARVERMLEVGGIAALLKQGANETVPPEIEAELARLKPEEGGERIGNYTLLQQIGEGGFGIVWMAEQIEPVQRRVALKIIKLGMDTKEVIARFEQERQALAMMDHPNIAKVFDAGATPTGRPFFVMELVRGIPITEYCDQNNLPTAERLGLFIAVCHAVQHAHQKGIIHRDLKPSNLLVTLHDGVPVPKVIDFGVAKATQSQPLTDLTLFTQLEQMIGTPLYMSPEQAGMSGLDIDTRSDIYSLGVLLYELLAGRTPFDPVELMRKGHDEIRRVIREQEPQKPSTALHTMTVELRTTIAQHRQSDGAKLIGQIRGDLDWIVMKALEKDRTRRYETANGLALDIKRHLDNEPVLARPASTLYRFRRLVRRNKLAFSAATIGGVLLLALAAVSTLSALRLREQRNEINESLGRAYLAQARAQRLSRVPGQRGESLRALAEAARIRPSIAVRNEVIAALALADLDPPVAWREATPDRHTDEIMLGPDGDRYVVFGAREGITIHRRQDGAVLAQLTTPDMVLFGRFSPDGRWLMAYDRKQHVFVWDLSRPGPGPHAHSTAILESSNYCAEFTPDSRAVAIAGRDRQFHLFDLPTGAESQRFDLGMTARPLKFDPTGKLFALTAGRELRIWDLARREVVAQRSHDSNGTDIAWHPHGRFVAVGWENGDLLLYDSVAGVSRWLPPHMQHVSSLAFDPRGEFLVSASWDGMQRFWDPPTGRLLFETKDGEAARVPRDGRHVAFLSEGGGIGARKIIRSGVFRTLTSARTGHPGLSGVDFSPDGRWIVSGERSGLHVWNVGSGSEVVSVASASAARPRFHPNGRFIVTCGQSEVLRWPFQSPADGDEVRAGPPEVLLSVPGDNFAEVRFTPDGEQFAVAGRRGSLVVNWSDPSQRIAFGQNLNNTGHDHVSLSADHRWVAGATFHGAGVTVWDARDGSLVQPLIPLENAQLAFSPDSRTLATGTARELVLWDTATWQPRRRIALHLTAAIPVPVAFSRDGALLAIAASRDEIQLLDPRTGHPVATLTPPLPLTLTALAFSADGHHLAAQTLGPVLHLWDLQNLRRELRALGLDW